MGLPLKRDTEKNDASESEDIPRVVIKEEAQEINSSVIEKLSEDLSEEESWYHLRLEFPHFLLFLLQAEASEQQPLIVHLYLNVI